MATVRRLVVGNPEPPEPVILICSRPKRGIRSPQAPYFSVFLPIRERLVHSRGGFWWQKVGNRVDLRPGTSALPRTRCFEQLREGVNKLVQTVFEKRVSDLFHRNAGSLQRLHSICGGFVLFRQARPEPSLVA